MATHDPITSEPRRFSFRSPLVATLCVFALSGNAARSEDQQTATAISPLRESLKETWLVEYALEQRPPNRGRRLITLDQDGRLNDFKTLTPEKRDRMLALAIAALESFAFEPPMGGVVDSPEMSLSVSSRTRRIKIQIREYDGETNQELKRLLEHFVTVANGGDPGPPPARNKLKRLSAIAGKKWSVNVAINDRAQVLVEDQDAVRDCALKAVRDFSFATVAGADEGTTTVSLRVESPSLEGFRRIEISEKWLTSAAVRKSFVSELVRFPDE